jgi:hypothetical protein
MQNFHEKNHQDQQSLNSGILGLFNRKTVKSSLYQVKKPNFTSNKLL